MVVIKSAAGPDKDAAARREARPYLEAHPDLEGLAPLLLDRSDKAGRELALHLASLFRTPTMLQAVRDFALGQRGSDKVTRQGSIYGEKCRLAPRRSAAAVAQRRVA